MDKYLLIAVIVMFIISITVHLLIGRYIRQYYKKQARYDAFKRYHTFYKSEKHIKERLKHYLQYIVFICPILNVLIASIELKNIQRVIADINLNIAKYEKNLKKQGVFQHENSY